VTSVITSLLVIQPFQTVAVDIFIWFIWPLAPKRSVNPPLTALYKPSHYLLTYCRFSVIY